MDRKKITLLITLGFASICGSVYASSSGGNPKWESITVSSSVVNKKMANEAVFQMVQSCLGEKDYTIFAVDFGNGHVYFFAFSKKGVQVNLNNPSSFNKLKGTSDVCILPSGESKKIIKGLTSYDSVCILDTRKSAFNERDVFLINGYKKAMSQMLAMSPRNRKILLVVATVVAGLAVVKFYQYQNPEKYERYMQQCLNFFKSYDWSGLKNSVLNKLAYSAEAIKNFSKTWGGRAINAGRLLGNKASAAARYAGVQASNAFSAAKNFGQVWGPKAVDVGRRLGSSAAAGVQKGATAAWNFGRSMAPKVESAGRFIKAGSQSLWEHIAPRAANAGHWLGNHASGAWNTVKNYGGVALSKFGTAAKGAANLGVRGLNTANSVANVVSFGRFLRSAVNSVLGKGQRANRNIVVREGLPTRY